MFVGWGVDGIMVVLVTVGCELGDWDVDGIMVVLVTVGCDVCWLRCGRYHGSVGDGGMCCLLVGVWTVSW